MLIFQSKRCVLDRDNDAMYSESSDEFFAQFAVYLIVRYAHYSHSQAAPSTGIHISVPSHNSSVHLCCIEGT